MDELSGWTEDELVRERFGDLRAVTHKPVGMETMYSIIAELLCWDRPAREKHALPYVQAQLAKWPTGSRLLVNDEIVEILDRDPWMLRLFEGLILAGSVEEELLVELANEPQIKHLSMLRFEDYEQKSVQLLMDSSYVRPRALEFESDWSGGPTLQIFDVLERQQNPQLERLHLENVGESGGEWLLELERRGCTPNLRELMITGNLFRDYDYEEDAFCALTREELEEEILATHETSFCDLVWAQDPPAGEVMPGVLEVGGWGVQSDNKWYSEYPRSYWHDIDLARFFCSDLCRQLQSLHLEGIELRGADLEPLHRVPALLALRELALRKDPLGPVGAEYLASNYMHSLRRLDLEGARICDDGLASIVLSASFPQLEHLILRDNQLEEVEALLRCPWIGQLKTLDLRSNAICWEAFEQICNEPRLQQIPNLLLGDNPFEDVLYEAPCSMAIASELWQIERAGRAEQRRARTS